MKIWMALAVFVILALMSALGALGYAGRHGDIRDGQPVRLDARDEEVLDFLTDSVEPTWILLDEIPSFDGNRSELEAVLHRFEQNGWVTRSREPSVNPARPPMELDDWWELTKEGWSAQGLQMPRGWGRRNKSF
jgi:hypothetical protein